MFINDMRLVDIDLAVLQRLIDSEIMEDQRLDYKLEFSTKEKETKREFLADIAAMANSMGGDIIYGVKEKRDDKNKNTGIPESFIGIDLENWDQFRLMLNDTIQENIAPRIQGIEYKPIDLGDGKKILIIRIPASLQSPHMIKSPPLFHYRTPGGKKPMDIMEIRQAFLRGDTIRERANLFRNERIKNITDKAIPVSLPPLPKILLHIIPLGIQPYSVSLSDTKTSEAFHQLRPLSTMWGLNSHINFDGWMTQAGPDAAGLSFSYVQVYRDGKIEFCDTGLFEQRRGDSGIYDLLRSPDFEQAVVAGLEEGLRVLDLFGIYSPIVVFLSIVGARGYTLNNLSRRLSAIRSFDRDILLPSGQLIETQQTAEEILKPIFDTIWNAAGIARCPLYREDGTWLGK